MDITNGGKWSVKSQKNRELAKSQLRRILKILQSDIQLWLELTHDYWHNFVSVQDEIKLCNIEEEKIGIQNWYGRVIF